jgi:histidine triad (HIT) family protein
VITTAPAARQPDPLDTDTDVIFVQDGRQVEDRRPGGRTVRPSPPAAGVAKVGRVSECLFCRIVGDEIPADVVWQSDRVIAFRDIDPKAPTHVLVIPKEHYATVGALVTADPVLLAEVVAGAHAVAVQEGLATDGGSEPGWRLVANTGSGGGQVVHHVHLHVLGGRRAGWPPG